LVWCKQHLSSAAGNSRNPSTGKTGARLREDRRRLSNSMSLLPSVGQQYVETIPKQELDGLRLGHSPSCTGLFPVDGCCSHFAITRAQFLPLGVGQRRSSLIPCLAPQKSLRSCRTFPLSRWYAALISVSAKSAARGSPCSGGGCLGHSIANENAPSASTNSLVFAKQSPLEGRANIGQARDKSIEISGAVYSPRGGGWDQDGRGWGARSLVLRCANPYD